MTPDEIASARELAARLQEDNARITARITDAWYAADALLEAIVALEAARAENERLRAELEQAENAAFCECGRVNL